MKKHIKESDIPGIDELVYNPVTGNPKGEDERGSDAGRLKSSIRWSNHDNHLHIGATNKEVMMKIIDKADTMGLYTTENPYAKKDPNKKVDRVHTSGSFHYKTFPGTPTVGMGVDISGNKEKIRELIKWIHNTFKGGNYPSQSGIDIDKDLIGTDNVSSGSSSTNTDEITGSDLMNFLRQKLNVTKENKFSDYNLIQENINRIKSLL